MKYEERGTKGNETQPTPNIYTHATDANVRSLIDTSLDGKIQDFLFRVHTFRLVVNLQDDLTFFLHGHTLGSWSHDE
jgi:hypothetical protein